MMFDQLIDRSKNGTSPGHGWGTFSVECEACGAMNTVVEMVYVHKVRSCNACGADLCIPVWLPPSVVIPCDGPWLLPVGWDVASPITRN